MALVDFEGHRKVLKKKKKALLLYLASMSREQGLVIVVFDITEPHCWKSKYQHQQVIDQVLQIQHLT